MSYGIWPYEVTGGFVCAMVLAGGVQVGAFIHRQSESPLARTYLFLTARRDVRWGGWAALGAGRVTWSTQAPILMLIPIAYLVASRIWRDGSIGAIRCWRSLVS